jgi:hypothetical protein
MKTAPTVGHARTLLDRASRRPVVKEVCRVSSARAIQIIREALRGRPAESPISPWLAEVISLLSCRHVGSCATSNGACEACGCFLCRRTAR